MKLRVLLADDHTLYRTALRMALERASDIEVVAEVADGNGALASIGHDRPDVVCMDINMPGMNGIETTRKILSIHPEMKIIGLSAHADASMVNDMVNAGALGYVVKSGAGAELIEAIHRVSRNRRYFSAEVSLGLAMTTPAATK